MRQIGFTFIRDGEQYDYPFLESFQSILGFCEELYVAAGDSKDRTTEMLKTLDRTHLIHTKWDENLRTGGKIFAQQTNVALDAAKAEGGWGFCIQADELILESDYEQIKSDVAYADANGYDAVRFRFFHFWETYQKIAIEKRWYPQEIRAIKLTPQVQSSGDCQSFSGVTKVFDSDVTIHHYGHARSRAAYEAKKKYMHRWWHDDKTVLQLLKKSARRDPREKTLRYLGPHPKLMAERIAEPDRPWADRVFLVGNPLEYSELSPRIRAKKVDWGTSANEFDGQGTLVLLEPTWLQNIFNRSKVKAAMRSEIARPWTKQTKAILRLSEKGIWVD